MNTSHWKKGLVAAALCLAAGCIGRGLGTTDLQGQGEDDGEKQLSGAIFTTTEDGTRVNENHYATTCDVYLNGGPERTGSAGLPAGDYYFMVTDPSGAVLLSTDEIEARLVTVDESGVFVSAVHPTGDNLVDGGATVQLCPFDLSPNPGCVHKAWLTPVEDHDPEDPQAVHGFLHNRSKTDNFKVCEEAPPPEEEEPPPEEEEAVCPNGIVEGDEECDDGNLNDEDGCSRVCTIENN